MPGLLPACLLHTGDVARESIQTELELFAIVSIRLSRSISVAELLTRAMRKSLKTPFPLAPMMQRFFICVGRV